MRKKLREEHWPEWAETQFLIFPDAPEACREYGCYMYLPREAARKLELNDDMKEYHRQECQARLERAGWTRDEFVETFGEDYLCRQS